MPLKVFISYSTKDLATVTRAKAVLEAAGHTAYIAEYSALGGEKLPDSITHAIVDADFVVVFWSKPAKESSWVDQEIGIAEGHRKMIIPVVLEEGIIPGGFLSTRKYVSAYGDPGKALAQLTEIIAIEKKRRDDETVKAIGFIGALLLIAAAMTTK